eukprot:TRINITY_DN12472_c1_g4_i1.p1 TRINITY_DN12472_c1_g4~~TRINITY_DN12472_c1_g4_i1.p1  ORF type:complete len:213 (+),score=31.82 TRINITY_DN12472_c1_g4_i1:47-685(+)
MACGLPTSTQCKVQTLSGDEYSVNVQTTWRIRELRKCVRTQFGIPEYEQGYVQGSVCMRSGDFVFPAQLHAPSEPVEVTLVRSTMPSCFSKSNTLKMWLSFLALSDDDGDTVQRERASQIARFEGMIELARAITAQNDLPERVSFLELLQCFAALRAQLPRATRPARTRAEQNFEDSLRLDIGNASCPRFQADDSESETDEDDSAEEDLDVN